MSTAFDKQKMFELLHGACKKAQEKGKFNLREASVVSLAVEYFTKGTTHEEIKDDPTAFQVLVSAVELAQLRGGVFELDEAANLYSQIMQLAEWAKASAVAKEEKMPVKEIV